MKVFLGLGSNLEPRKKTLQKALQKISTLGPIEKISSLYETPALLPLKAPTDWNKPFLNMALQMEFQKSPLLLLQQLKSIETALGRPLENRQKWAPRPIDLDILLFGDQKISSPELKIPHPELEKRAFVLDPLKDILPSFIPKARKHKHHAPLWMAIVNLTPDSFSDGGQFTDDASVSETFKTYENKGVHIIDLGAESTRPGAAPLSSEEELTRLNPVLNRISEFSSSSLRPLFSIDTRHIKTAEAALKQGVDIINDVSGLKNLEMLSLLKNSKAAYILTHSLDVPVNLKNTLKEDPLKALPFWLDEKLELLEKHHISWDHVFFDPGIGFGKNSLQSIRILQNLKIFKDCPVRILIGHSRKSFMKDFSSEPAKFRDPETLGVSFQLIRQGVDVLRLHNPEMHIRAFKGWSHIAPV